jgi:anti-sigma regulatory factor (Ser/Thr protein kinase)
MVNTPHTLIAVPNRTYQAIARSEIKRIAGTVGFAARRLAEIEIIVAEITSNLVKHTSAGGEILIKSITGDNPGIELISIDAGPGMESVLKMMEDGVSSTNTMGQGLGAIRRLSDDFEIYSLKDWGTILLSRIYIDTPVLTKKKPAEVRVLMVCKEGESVCGDNYHCSMTKSNQLKLILTDGLGHGKAAALAADESIHSFLENSLVPPNEQIRRIHLDIKSTRGAVINISYLDFTNKQIMYCGVGNISSKILTAGKNRNCISYNGIVGHSIPRTLNNHVLQWNRTDILILHSDGLSTRWDLQKYPMITKHDFSIIAAALYKDHCRKNDDVTIAVIGQYNKKA